MSVQVVEVVVKCRVPRWEVDDYIIRLRNGEPLVKVCAESGTDYCDLTGEVQWIRRMLQGYEKTARRSGARIVLETLAERKLA